MIVGVGRYRAGHEVDVGHSQLIRSAGTLTPDAVALIKGMHARSTQDVSDFVWVALAGPSEAELAALAEVFDIPALWVADALNPLQRAKAELGSGPASGLIVFKIVSYDDELSSVETGQITLMIGPSHVITVRLGPLGALGRVRAALVERPERLALGPIAAIHGIVDAIVDDYVFVTDEIGLDIDEMQERVFSPARTDDTEAIYRLKRENMELRRAIEPLTPVALRLVQDRIAPGLPQDLRAHFHDVADHLLHASDAVEANENLLMAMLQAAHARLGLQQNTDLRRVAAYAALLAVPTAIAGIYGMNFVHMPELTWRWGYPLILLLMAIVGGVMYRAFKRSGWL